MQNEQSHVIPFLPAIAIKWWKLLPLVSAVEAEYEYEWQYLPVYVGGSSEAVWELEALDPPWRAGPATQDRGSIPPSAFTLQPREGQRLAFEIHG